MLFVDTTSNWLKNLCLMKILLFGSFIVLVKLYVYMIIIIIAWLWYLKILCLILTSLKLDLSVLILLCQKPHATKKSPTRKQSTTPITFKSNDNHQSKGRVTTELLHIRIFNRYARKDTKERIRLNPIKARSLLFQR